MKIALIAAAFALPMIAIMTTLLHQIDEGERVSRQELRAAGTIDSVMDLLRRVEDYRDTVALALPATAGMLPHSLAKDNVRHAIANFDTRTNERFGAKPLWEAVLRAAQAAYLDRPGASGANETALIEALFKYTDTIADRSYLTYDSRVDVQSMADIIGNNYARSIDGIRMANLIAVRAAVVGKLGVRDRVALYAAKQRFASRIQTLLDDVRVSAEATPSLHARLIRLVPGLFTDATRLANLLERDVIESEVVHIRAEDLDGLALRAQAGFETADSLASPALRWILQDRMGRMQARKLTIAISTFLAIGIGVLIAAQIIRTISKRDRDALARVEQRAAFLSLELAREQAERALRVTEAQFRTIFKDAAIGIAILDKRGKILESNPTFVAMLGADSPSPLFLYHQFFDRLMDGIDNAYEIEHPIVVGADQEKWVAARLSIVRAADEGTFVVWMLQDITERKRTEQRLVHDATHDGLTGLANRHCFETELRAAFGEAAGRGRLDFAVLFVDLDHFKYVNDSFGHAIGDSVLATVADRLRASINANDLVARFGGDEFAILLRGVEDKHQIDSIGRRIQRNIEQPLAVGGSTIVTTASIGISVASQNYARAEDMLRDADTAMYNAKLGGRAQHVTFDSVMHARATNHLTLQSELRAAIDTRAFRLVYQPVVRMQDKSLVGCEALIRWDHPQRGVVSPSDFMPAAEQMGLAIPIGRFVLRTACEQLAEWAKTGSELGAISMNVNVSVSELFAPDFEAFAVQTLRETGVPGSAITLEITESAIIDRESHASELIDRLKSHGLRICIDDFGTGYSSFRYLQQFKIDTLKIDRSFVCGEDGDLASAPIVQSLISLGEAFSVRIVAEGVETELQRRKLIELRCNYGQGFLFAKPGSPALLLPV